jgi:hypothetical protein
MRTLTAILVPALAGILIGLGGYTFIYAKGYSYLTNEPAACANCHVMRDHFDQIDRSLAAGSVGRLGFTIAVAAPSLGSSLTETLSAAEWLL